MGGKITEIDTVSLDEANKALVIIDQTKLPGQIQMLSLTKAKEIWDAIYLLQVRGAPAIGVAAAIGMYVLAARYEVDDYDAFYAAFCRDKEYLDSSRPTAVNLSWALKRMEDVVTAMQMRVFLPSLRHCIRRQWSFVTRTLPYVTRSVNMAWNC